MKTESNRLTDENAPAFVARQPIYDTAMTVTAYKLLYRALAQAGAAPDPKQVTLRVIANAALEVGLERLAGDLPVHIGFPRELLVTDPLLPIHPKRIVVEIEASMVADDEVLKALQLLRARGHDIAVNGYMPGGATSLLDLAHIVKINVERVAPAALSQTVEEPKRRKLRLVADEVQSIEQFEYCIELGFEGFQGDFLHHPQTFVAQRVPTSRFGSLRLVAALQSEDFSIDEVERLISQDVSISFRVLRCINSSYYNLPRKVESIRQAIVILGLENLRRLCTLVALQGFDDRPPSLFVNAMTRARMCEQLGKLTGAKEAGPYFITGLFSMLNVLTGQKMEDIVKELPLSAAISNAMLREEGELGAALKCARAYERASWKHSNFAGLAPQLIRAAYVDAVFWAEEARALFSS
jgi:EAL and modified HD-GYP domain-containing signal transduction protein